MFAAAPLPYYSAYRPQKRKGNNNTTKNPSSPISAKAVPSSPNALNVQQHSSNTIADLLEPAVDGPPSPERIRALNQQMKRASVRDKHQSHNTTSSGSSSLRSLTSDRPSWEQTLDNMTLSRRSSGRSTASSMPSRERPESVQFFGKTIFNRRAKLKRESSAHSSSGSSLYSAELPPPEGPPSSTRETFAIPAIFNRRRTMKPGPIDEERQASPRKLQISGPYNFQHVTHTHREHLPNFQRTSRVELVTEFSAHRAAQTPTSGSLKGIAADDLHFSNFSSEAVHLRDEPSPDQQRAAAHYFLHRPPPVPPVTGPRRLVKHSRSQEQLRPSPPRPPAPPRPPRSPVEPVSAPPVPPPRISSRLSMRYDGYDPLATTTLERPQTSGGFRHPKPFSPPAGTASSPPPPPPSTSHGYVGRPSDFDRLPDARFSHALTTPDDAAWPLSATTPTFPYDAALPDVPEEEESYNLSRRSRASLVSTNSSLRGSHSVPVLRQLAQAHSGSGTARPPSGASDTLGRFDMFAAQRAMRAAMQDNPMVEVLLARESWEDDIDYCYEHEADADFEYAWDRPSLELSREQEAEDESGAGSVAADRVDEDLFARGLRPAPQPHSPGHLTTPQQFDVPALSPAASQASTVGGPEALTPTVAAVPVTSNFSHPRLETTYRGQVQTQAQPQAHGLVRTPSYASSFKESHGFHLCPSDLLIPGDLPQQHMIMSDADMDTLHEGFVNGTSSSNGAGQFSYDAEPTLTMTTVDMPGLFAQDRASTSTTGTNSTDQTSSSGERHVSTNSTWTTLTRFTGSTSYEGWNPKSDFAEPLPSGAADDWIEPASPKLTRSMTMDRLQEADEAMSQSTPDLGTAPLDSPTSPISPTRRTDPRVARDSLQLSKAKENMPIKHRRQRAKTTSLTTPPPPPGQYALFPPVYNGNRV